MSQKNNYKNKNQIHNVHFSLKLLNLNISKNKDNLDQEVQNKEIWWKGICSGKLSKTKKSKFSSNKKSYNPQKNVLFSLKL